MAGSFGPVRRRSRQPATGRAGQERARAASFRNGVRRIFATSLAVLVLAAAACARTDRVADATTGSTAEARTAAATTGPTAAARTAAAAASPRAIAWCHSVPAGRPFCQTVVVVAPKQTLQLAVADTDARREHGLMGVKKVPNGEGMIFVFPDGDQMRSFWMKNTIAPLDMIFVRSDGIVMATAENVAATKPGTPDANVARRSGVGRYVIELRAGGAGAAGIEPGTRLALPAIAAQ
jgi:uncharacterized protein